MINQGQLKKLDKPVFSTGDAYLVVDKEGKKIFIWLGSKCSVDEKGTAAVEARRIDEADFSGAAKIVTYDEGLEEPEFIAKLNGLRVEDKNLAKTMLKDVSSGEFAGQAEFKKALYRVSSEEFEGINAIKYVQVPFAQDSLDGEDCFIADLGVEIYVWQGKDSNVKEKVKSLQFARGFDADRAGAQTPKVFEQGEDADFLKIFDDKFTLKQDRACVEIKAECFQEGSKEDLDAKKKADAEAEAKRQEEDAKKAAEEAKKAEDAEKKAAEEQAKQDAENVKKAAEAQSASSPAVEAKSAPVEETKSAPSSKVESHPAPTPGKAEPPVLVCKGTRLACPKCGNVMRNMFREVEDRGHVVMDYPLIYGKKYICGKCGSHFRKDE